MCLACGATAFRRESRRLMNPKIPKVQMFVCNGPTPHFMELVSFVIHTDVVGQPKKVLNRYSTKGAIAARAAAQDDYDE